ncbi:hypothetical protein Misp01_52550 [Microtetraspora sp. NBRC 13810]|nr:hypothetical protein Misp01_52550 [Microtetraspora sp. NBRC 13810]
MSGKNGTLLLTGGSGVMGQALIDELAGDFDLVCLRHRKPLNDQRVTEVVGDLGRDDLGLAPDQVAELGRRVDLIVHSAAATGWQAKRAAIFATNLGGTRRMLAFAARAAVP